MIVTDAAPAVAAGDAEAIAAHDALVRRIERAAGAAGSAEDGAACAQAAAHVAWFNHPGRFASRDLERILGEAACELPGVPATPAADPRRVLHVLTEGYDTGGHTRLAWRWMLQDATRTHGLAVTRHRPVPRPLLEALAARGAESIEIPGPGASLLQRAARLREIAAGYDVVLLHIHPDDPVPSLAFGGGHPRPPVVFVNHADHCFWLGREVADLVVSHREVGSKLSVERRGVPAERTAILPLPLGSSAAAPRADRDQARRALGIEPGQVVLLTVGDAYKFGPVGGAHFLDAAESVVATHPEAVLLAVGPAADDARFADAARRTGGRVRALGTLSGIDHLYAAADVYLESYPCSSATAVREAAAHSTPVVTFAPDPVESEMLGSDVSLASAWQRATDVDGYAAILSGLIRDPGARERWRSAAAAAVEECDDHAWTRLVGDLYARAAMLGPVAAGELAEPAAVSTRYDAIVHRIHAMNGKNIPLSHAEGTAAILEVAAHSAPARNAFGSLCGVLGRPERRLRYAVALAAPGPDRASVNATVEEFRRLSATGVAETLRMNVSAAAVDAVVPLVEAALAAGPDVDVDLDVVEDPLHGYGPGTLLVTAPNDAFGDLPAADFPLQHAAR